MPKTRDQKKKEIEKLVDALSRMKSMVIVNYEKLKVNEINELRKSLREQRIDYFIAKKTLLKLALEKAKMKIDLKGFVGNQAIAFNYEDEVKAAKLLYEFSKTHENLKLTGGVMAKELIDKDKVLTLAKLPSLKELKAQAVYIIKSPISGFVHALKGNLSKLVCALKAIAEKGS